MSKQTAHTESEPGPSSEWELTNEIEKKLAQAKGILVLIGEGENDLDEKITNSLWAACDLIVGANEGVEELWSLIVEARKGQDDPRHRPGRNA